MSGSDLSEYYARRAREYESIYAKPERRADLATLRELVRRELAGHDVLEIACGTGYWTAIYAPVVRSVLATDVVEETLALARTKTYPPGRVRFATADAFAPIEIPGEFTAAFAGFWWSHLSREELGPFLTRWHERLGPGARAVFLDNRYVAGSSTPIARTDAAGNTYQRRTLEDGSVHEVRKNFPTASELREAVAGTAASVVVTELQYFWFLAYTVARAVG